MRNILIILFCFIPTFCLAQSFQDRSSGVVTTQDGRLAAKYIFYFPRNETDTTLNGSLDTLGAVIFIKSGSLQGLWVRDSILTGGHKWIRQATTADNYWQLSGNTLSPISTSYNVGIGTATPLYRFDVFDGIAGHLAFQNGRLTLYDDIDDQNVKIGFGAGETLSGTFNLGIGASALANSIGERNIGIGTESGYDYFGNQNVSIGVLSAVAIPGSDNVSVGTYANAQTYGINNVAIGSLAQTAASSFEDSISNTEIDIGTSAISGSEVAAFITSASLSVGVNYMFRMDFGGTMPTPFVPASSITQIRRGVITNASTITFHNFVTFTGQGSGKFFLTTFNKQNNSIAIGYGVESTQSNEIAIGNVGNTVLRVNQFVVDIQDMPTAGEVLTFDGTVAKWDTITGGGGGAYSFLSPLNEAAGVVSIQNAVADGATKGAASFTATDFNATSGNLSLDYTNAQAASTTLKGFLTNTDWNTFNNKLSNITGYIVAGSNVSITGSGTSGTPYVISSSGGGGGGITSLNGLSSFTQTFATGTSGTDFAISSASSTHTFNLPIVSAANTGKVTPTLFNTWNAKQDAITGAATTAVSSNFTSSRVAISNASGKLDVSTVTTTELTNLVLQYTNQTLTDGATITMNCNSGFRGIVTLAGNRTLAFSNFPTKGDIQIKVIQDATGNRTLTLPANSKVPIGMGSGTTINLTTTGSAYDILYCWWDGVFYNWTIAKQFQ